MVRTIWCSFNGFKNHLYREGSRTAKIFFSLFTSI
ncbi:putative beta-mannosyltransferase, required for addition of the first beta-mannose residue to the acid-stable fraction of cell wall phosphopeptidomannan [Candida albicans P76067]|nr:putative beta-mannosyltransferase, required for addition of the first beta-mannose residue to the acid-stable fraction of cell wall phosphopeptidomannan [Candida albicans P76067]